MFRRAALSAVVFLLLLPGISAAQELEGIQEFIELSYSPDGGALGSGIGGAFGLRYRNLGFRFGTLDKQEVETVADDPVPAPPANTPSYQVTTTSSKGQKGQSFGLDLDFYYDVTRLLSVYVSPGLYFHTEQEAFSHTDNLSSVSPGADNRTWTTAKTRTKFEPAVSAGAQFGIPVSPDIRIIVGAGYHSLRGGTVALGFMW